MTQMTLGHGNATVMSNPMHNRCLLIVLCMKCRELACGCSEPREGWLRAPVHTHNTHRTGVVVSSNVVELSRVRLHVMGRYASCWRVQRVGIAPRLVVGRKSDFRPGNRAPRMYGVKEGNTMVNSTLSQAISLLGDV